MSTSPWPNSAADMTCWCPSAWAMLSTPLKLRSQGPFRGDQPGRGHPHPLHATGPGRDVLTAAAPAQRSSCCGVTLDRCAVAAAVERLGRAGRVEWVGVASAGLVAAEGALKLRKLGVDSIAHADGHQQVMSAALLGQGDVLIVVSHSGRTLDVLESAEAARAGGASVIAITGVTASPLARLADTVLPTVSFDTAFQVEPMASMLAQLAMVQVLFLALLEAGGHAAVDRLARTQQVLESRHVRGRLR